MRKLIVKLKFLIQQEILCAAQTTKMTFSGKSGSLLLGCRQQEEITAKYAVKEHSLYSKNHLAL